MKDAFHDIIGRLETAEERFSELEDILIETTEAEKHWEKGLKKKKQKIQNCGTTEKGITHA